MQFSYRALKVDFRLYIIYSLTMEKIKIENVDSFKCEITYKFESLKIYLRHDYLEESDIYTSVHLLRQGEVESIEINSTHGTKFDVEPGTFQKYLDFLFDPKNLEYLRSKHDNN